MCRHFAAGRRFHLRHRLLFAKFKIDTQPPLTDMIRWTAGILSIISIGIMLLFMAGEGFSKKFIKPVEWILFLFFPFGISVGMILSWWKEGIGGSIAVGSLLMFYAVHFIIEGKFPSGWAWLVFTIPGFLFLLFWYRTRKSRNAAAKI
jgi:hypothetical protein